MSCSWTQVPGRKDLSDFIFLNRAGRSSLLYKNPSRPDFSHGNSSVSQFKLQQCTFHLFLLLALIWICLLRRYVCHLPAHLLVFEGWSGENVLLISAVTSVMMHLRRRRSLVSLLRALTQDRSGFPEPTVQPSGTCRTSPFCPCSLSSSESSPRLAECGPRSGQMVRLASPCCWPLVPAQQSGAAAKQMENSSEL